MPIAFIFDSDQLGEADYDGLMKAIGRDPRPPRHRSLAHLSAK